MPRTARLVLPGLPHHITQRGNYRQKTFFRAEDYSLYLDLLGEYSRHYGVSILAYCLMPNHVHVVATPHNPKALGRLFQRVQSDYSRALHLRLRRTGHLWQSRYHSVPLDEEHFWASMVYVEQNPLRAGLVADPVQWPWSSAKAHLSGNKNSLLDLVVWQEKYTPESWKRCIDLGLWDASLLERIREGTLTGRPVGGEDFLKRLELEFGLEAKRKLAQRQTLQVKAVAS